jgi:phosphatidylinositol kinase/protein kinase (PI-3  family)
MHAPGSAAAAADGPLSHHQARGAAESIIASVALMAASGLPCFGRGRPLENLRRRFNLDMSDAQAAAFMRATVADAYDKVRFQLWCL